MEKKQRLDNYHVRAFTLLESVVALFVLSLASLLLITNLSSMKTVLTYHAQHTSLDVYRFFSYVENHLSSELIHDVTSEMIITKDETKYIYYEMYRNLIRRRGEKGGHEPLLAGVRQWEIDRTEHVVTIRVLMENDETYEKNVFITADKKE